MQPSEELSCPNCGENEEQNLIVDNRFGEVEHIYCTTCHTQTTLDSKGE